MRCIGVDDDGDDLLGGAAEVVGDGDGKRVGAEPAGCRRGEGPGAGHLVDSRRADRGRCRDAEIIAVGEALDVGCRKRAGNRHVDITQEKRITADDGRIVHAGKIYGDDLVGGAADIVGDTHGKAVAAIPVRVGRHERPVTGDRVDARGSIHRLGQHGEYRAVGQAVFVGCNEGAGDDVIFIADIADIAGDDRRLVYIVDDDGKGCGIVGSLRIDGDHGQVEYRVDLEIDRSAVGYGDLPGVDVDGKRAVGVAADDRVTQYLALGILGRYAADHGAIEAVFTDRLRVLLHHRLEIW